MNKIKDIEYSSIFSNESLILKLIEKDQAVLPFVSEFSSKEGILRQIQKKSQTYTFKNRKILCESLILQGNDTKLVARLSKENCYTITTGHQLNVFTGPLYSVYKILTVINTAEFLKHEYPAYDFVPVFWMATEDHDFQEMNHIHLFDKKIEWTSNQNGAVGRFNLDDIDEFLKDVKVKFKNLPSDILDLISCYELSSNLNEAHRKIVNKLFNKKNILIIDGDDKLLKGLFTDEFKLELSSKSNDSINETNLKLEKNNFKIQAFSRPINLFYLHKKSRSRIEQTNLGFRTVDHKHKWTQEEILSEIDAFPQNFSPNVLMRPIYQETILPNLMYVGGGGELAYWLQLKNSFDAFKVTMPMLQLRFSALLISEKQNQLINKLGFKFIDLFKNVESLIEIFYNKNKEDFNIEDEYYKVIESLRVITQKGLKIDESLLGYFKSEEKKIQKEFKSIEKKIRKHQKIKMGVKIKQITRIKNELFPFGNWQERSINILEFLISNPKIIDDLKPMVQPFNNTFSVLIH